MNEVESVFVKGYKLANMDKVRRALKGSPNAQGEFVGGVEKADGSYEDDALLAEYDRIGGLILKGSDKVRTGSFYDFGAKAPAEKPKVELEFRVNGELIFVPEGKELPGELRAAQVVEKKKATKKAAKKSKK
jgi:hypothetical protein